MTMNSEDKRLIRSRDEVGKKKEKKLQAMEVHSFLTSYHQFMCIHPTIRGNSHQRPGSTLINTIPQVFSHWTMF